ncbi:MAG: hypothetical protein JNL60_13010, partial [Bacteroidia bacterium]|nr:hypothetical protein [Bacteroidia bacterium]
MITFDAMNKKLLLQTILTFISLNYYCQAAFNKGSGYVTMGYGFPPLFEEILIDKKIGYGYSTGGFSHS